MWKPVSNRTLGIINLNPSTIMSFTSKDSTATRKRHYSPGNEVDESLQASRRNRTPTLLRTGGTLQDIAWLDLGENDSSSIK